MRSNFQKGISVIEILIYMALLGALISISFSMAFMLGSDRDYLSNSTERQLYGISLLEYVRSESRRSPVTTPAMGATSTGFETGDQYLVPSIDEFRTPSHIFKLVPKNIVFYRNTNQTLETYGNFGMRGTTTRPFQILFNTWTVR